MKSGFTITCWFRWIARIMLAAFLVLGIVKMSGDYWKFLGYVIACVLFYCLIWNKERSGFD